MNIITIRPNSDPANPFHASFVAGSVTYSAIGATAEEALGRLLIQSGQRMRTAITVKFQLMK